jgi:hypothetical protein
MTYGKSWKVPLRRNPHEIPFRDYLSLPQTLKYGMFVANITKSFIQHSLFREIGLDF